MWILGNNQSIKFGMITECRTPNSHIGTNIYHMILYNARVIQYKTTQLPTHGKIFWITGIFLEKV